MSFAGLCDHRGIVHRSTTTRDEFDDVILTWAALPAPAGKNCRPNQNWSGVLQDSGPGALQGAMRQWFLRKEFDIKEGDLLAIVTGPEAGVLLWVQSVTRPTAPQAVHHLEVNVRVWDGELS